MLTTMKQKYIFALVFCLACLPLTTAWAETYEDKSHHFKISYNDEWQVTNAISPTIKFSLSSVKRAASGRPSASAKVRVSELDKTIPLKKYIKNNVKIASETWKVIEEKSLPAMGDENLLMKMERRIGSHSKKVQTLFVKAKGNVYEVTCSMAKVAEASFEKSCADVIDSFALLP